MSNLERAFVHNRNPERLRDIPSSLICRDLSQFAEYVPDLVVECAHPEISFRYGASFLQMGDYMPLSVTAFANEGFAQTINQAIAESGRHIFIPQGALIGVDSLTGWRHMWKDVTITFRKHPRNIDFSESSFDPGSIAGETIVYDGPVRGIALQYPRNVNTMVTCALATVGLDRCRARLVADPSLNEAIAEVEAWGTDGSYHNSVKRQPVTGVSGTEMLQSALRSVIKATGAWAPTDFL